MICAHHHDSGLLRYDPRGHSLHYVSWCGVCSNCCYPLFVLYSAFLYRDWGAAASYACHRSSIRTIFTSFHITDYRSSHWPVCIAVVGE